MLLFLAIVAVAGLNLANGACPETVAPDVPCYPVGETCYCFSYVEASWATANQVCRSNPEFPRGRLLSIETGEENELILNKINSIPGLVLNNQQGFWTSGTDGTTEGTWFWNSNGDPFTFTNWNPGEPDNDDDQDCVMMYKPYGYRWDDGYCDSPAAYICEGPVA